MAGPSGSAENVKGDDGASMFGPGVPAFPVNATAEQKDAHWFKHVYQGDKMPQLTLRAVLTGGILGMLLAASNLYTTLTVGWAFGVAITASVISFVLWSVITPLVGCRKMSILETNCMASTASAAGYSTGSTIATMFGALVLMAVPPDGKIAAEMKTWEIHPAWLIVSFTLLTGLMGVFLAIPMKRQMINHEQLPFPSGIAAAETLRSLYSESKEATQKAYVLLVGLGVGALVAVLRAGEGTFHFLDRAWLAMGSVLTYMVEPKDAANPAAGMKVASGPIPESLPKEGFSLMQGKQVYGWSVDTSVLLIAAGMIVGLRVSLSMLLGSCILYFWLGPMLLAHDAANVTTANYVPSIEAVGGGTIWHFPRWGLWGGTALLVMSSLTALAFQWKTIVRSLMKPIETGGEGAADQGALQKIEVPFIWMVVGMVPITIGMLIIQVIAFDIAWWAGLIAIGMSFVLSLVACRATGETDTTPIGAMGKVMQLLFALLKPGQVGPNLASAGIAANSASSSADLLTDLKVGYLLGANPRRQFLAQFWGVFFGTLAIVPIWYLMVPTRAALEKLPAPATQTWAKVAQVLTKGYESLPESARIAILVGAAVGVLLPLIEKFVVPAAYRKYMPSAAGLGLAFMLPFYNSLAFVIGAVIAWCWGKFSAKTCLLFCVPLASGLVAGESLIAAFIAMLKTATGLLGWNW